MPLHTVHKTRADCEEAAYPGVRPRSLLKEIRQVAQQAASCLAPQQGVEGLHLYTRADACACRLYAGWSGVTGHNLSLLIAPPCAAAGMV